MGGPAPDDELRGGETVRELAAALASGATTSSELVARYLDRIDRLDGYFGAVRHVCAAAPAEAGASDDHRRRHGPRGPLEGIPVLVKDNVDVAGVATTAGALGLEHSVPSVDAHLVAALRRAGAVILGKTNLSELANFLTAGMPSGYSSLGGQVLNPYDTSVTPSGSSSGSATAVALGLAPVAVGTETDGSITSPAVAQSLVGVKPTLGLVSRSGILPIAASQDTAGPMARTVADAAALLAGLAGPDPADPATRRAPGAFAAPAPAALDGVRVGVVRVPADPSGAEPGAADCHAAALAALRGAGALLSEVELPEADETDELTVLHYEFAPGVDRYLAALGPGAGRRSLADLRDWNLAHADVALKFGQSHVETAVAVDHAADRAAYTAARARDLAASRAALEAALGDDLEVLVFPGCEGCGWAARAGWPSVVLPAGYSAPARRPVGIMVVSRPWSDSRLLSLAAGLEAHLPARRPPWEINPAVFRRFT